ncbi:MAG: hypothetical protein KKD77_20695 [Gammaproteobacteria bacterium]|nr:hypothetical protein [Gammaproteobacteria bacterium]
MAIHLATGWIQAGQDYLNPYSALGISPERMKQEFLKDMSRATRDAIHFVPAHDHLNAHRRAVLIVMAYHLGAEIHENLRLKLALLAGRCAEAALESLTDSWRKKVGDAAAIKYARILWKGE